MIPGELLIDDGEHELNPGRAKLTIVVANSGDRPIQVGSHYHFAETNGALSFDRAAARGMRLNIPSGTAVRFDTVAQGRRQGVNQAALDAVGGDHRLTGAQRRVVAGHAHRHALEGLARMAAAEMFAPAAPVRRPRRGGDKAAVGRTQGRHVRPPRRQQRHPRAVRTQPRPARAAQSQHHGVGTDVALALRRGKAQGAVRVPAQPAVAHMHPHAGFAQALQPGTQQRRRLHAFRKDTAGTAGEGGNPQRLHPSPQRFRTEGVEQRRDLPLARTVAGEEAFRRFGMGDVQPAAPGQQELAPHRGHGVEDLHPHPAAGQGLGGHQAGRAAADDGDAGAGGRSRRSGHRRHGGRTEPEL